MTDMLRILRRKLRASRAWWALGGLMVCVMPSCEEREAEVASAVVAEPMADHECGACGMIVREEPSPRAQLVHRDGTHVWFCSIADVVAYMGAPSPHGRIQALWVETLDVAVEPSANGVAARPWMRAEEATFVLGVPRERVMGQAVLTFASATDASSAAARLGGSVVAWSDVVVALGGVP